jgi:hypothetical protein
MGRVSAVLGVFPDVMHRVIPQREAAALKRREAILGRR